MDDLERDGARLLGPLRDFTPPEPADGLGSGRAARAGRRRVRLRRAAGTASVAIGVIAAVASAQLLGQTSGRGARPVAQATFDPSQPILRAGSAGGFTPRRYEP